MAEKCRLLIADPSAAVRDALREVLAEDYELRLCCDGRSALELLRRFRPDILVLDLMLPGMDGLSLLRAAADAGITPAVLATTRYENDYILDAAYRLGVSYIMLRPFPLAAMVDRIQDLARNLREETVPEDIHCRVRRILMGLGFSVTAKRYGVLEDAIVFLADNPGAFLSKELYSAVGKAWGMSGIAVEKRVRDLLRAAWERGDLQIWALYFPPDANGSLSCPSNGEFLARIADCLPTALERAADHRV